jgi:type VI protein secretion system component VasF
MLRMLHHMNREHYQQRSRTPDIVGAIVAALIWTVVFYLFGA